MNFERRQTERKPGEVAFTRLPPPRKIVVRSILNEFKLSDHHARMHELSLQYKALESNNVEIPEALKMEIRFLTVKILEDIKA